MDKGNLQRKSQIRQEVEIMKYDGYKVGPIIRDLRRERKMTVEQVSELMGLSNSSINQIEQGGRNLSIRTLYMFMEIFDCDANTVLNIKEKSNAYSIDERIKNLPKKKQEFLYKSFSYMIEAAMQEAI